MAEWISVKDRLPKCSTNVLGYTGSAIMQGLYIGNGVWAINYYNYYARYENVFTHWMPLPKLPKEEE